ncbi:MAG: protein-glutamate O-methyltransferase [Candidatus Eisenbacteria bacterium]|uniref:protein-glutamate O-methyltransferase n=1 Tax=Eiseniibacteriota bacterium TaxID=2212470 RepID=A0A956M0A2_UNCEI|nr:protein-glutamate O-methyltransferase [Candidatus Eisenbacteria bacterium]
MTRVGLNGPRLSDEQFGGIQSLLKRVCGINLGDNKKELVQARLGKRIRQLGLDDYREYLEFLGADESGNELIDMVDALSTNVTSFFREGDHFDYLRDEILPRCHKEAVRSGHRLRIWSAGCSSGEEPYSIGIQVAETLDLRRWDFKVLATDISTRMVRLARRAIYEPDRLRSMEAKLISKYFLPTAPGATSALQVRDEIRGRVQVARLNLLERWPMKGPFDVIFCRNVMIYFDQPTRRQLIRRYHHLLAPRGTLFVGHSESLAGIDHDFRYIRPSVYEKAA